MTAQRIAFIDGQVFNPKTGTCEQQNIVLANGVWVGAGYVPDEDPDITVFSAKDCVIIPNCVDSHISFGTLDPTRLPHDLFQLQAKSGVTACMAIQPACDTPESVWLNRSLSPQIPCSVFFSGSLSKGGLGEQLAEMTLMYEAGAHAFTDGNSPNHPGLMRQALHYSGLLDIPLIVSPHDPLLSDGGMMNEGYYSSVLGLKGIPAVGEALRVSRDLLLLETFGGSIHFAPITTAQSVALIRHAKDKGLNVTCGTAPQYLIYNESDLESYPTSKKMFPPLRRPEDSIALLEGLKDGTIDVLASHHSTQNLDDKFTDFVQASFGASTIESWVSAVFNVLYHQHQCPLSDIIPKLSTRPQSIFKWDMPKWGLRSSPSFSVIKLNEDYSSKVYNDPFLGQPLRGKCLATVVNGKMVVTLDNNPTPSLKE
jgi:dihydroorotase